ncbi:MAG: tetratricopeptide repeat protein [Myxococcota bacterium]
MADTPEPERSLATILSELRPEASGLGARQTKAKVLERFGAATAPSRLDRYTILHELGRGGWGVVYAAYDTRLQRRVALKLLHERLTGERPDQLLHEAQAMARLSHRNVVAVHDVGEDDGQMFVVMDLVEGVSMHQWLARKRPPWPAIVERFIEAGRGLQGAHEAGLVHRDFKPSNVLMGDDGRVQVTDFGVAARQVDLQGPRAPAGTVGLQAPEILAEGPVGAAADQFSFCASLRQALETASGPSAPPWLEHVIARGVQERPEDRWPSMQELLDALDDRLRGGARRRQAIGLGALGAVTMAGAVGLWAGAAPTACESAATGTRNSVQAADASIRQAFVTASPERGEARWNAARTRLNAFAREIGDQRLDACAEPPTDDERRRQICLDRRGWELDSLLDVLQSAEPGVVEHATMAVTLLVEGRPCTDAVVGPPLPTREQYTRTLPAQQRLARAKELQHAGQYAAALEQAEVALSGAEGAGYEPLVAEAGYRRAIQLVFLGRYAEAREQLVRTLASAERGRHDHFVSWSQILLASVDGFYRGQPAAGRAWAEAARASISGLDDDPLLLGALLGTQGAIARAEGDYTRALDYAERALAARRASLPEHHPYVGAALLLVGNVRYERGEHDAALDVYEQALAIRTDALGPDHSETGVAHNNVALPLMALQRTQEADAHLRRALEIWSRTPSDVMHVLRARYNRLQIAITERRLEQAHQGLAALRDDIEAQAPDNLGLLANTETSLASVSIERGDFEGARRHLEAARARTPAEHPGHGDIEGRLGELALAQRDFARARTHSSRALEIARVSYEAEAPAVLGARVALASAECEGGELNAAALAELMVLRELAGHAPSAPLRRIDVDQRIVRCHVAGGRPEDARAWFAKLEEPTPDEPAFDVSSRALAELWSLQAERALGSLGTDCAARLKRVELALGPSRPRYASWLDELRECDTNR